MKSIILCGGYGTRLYPLTLNKPKSLLPVNGKPLLDYIVEKIPKNIDEIILLSNSKFYELFSIWSKNYGGKIKLVDDGTFTNETRIGAISGLELAIGEKNITDDVLVISGDNLFDFKLDNFISFFRGAKSTSIGVYKPDRKELKKFGVVEVNNCKVVSFEEKPQNPKSDLASIGIYIFTKDDLEKIKKYSKIGKPKDAPGFLIKDLVENGDDVFAFEFTGRWFDIGSREVYEEINKTW